jgi:hypothetical protein
MKARTHNRTLAEIDQALEFTKGHMAAAARLLGIPAQAITNAVTFNDELSRWRRAPGFQPNRLPFRLGPEPEPRPKPVSQEKLAEMMMMSRIANLIKGADRDELLAWLEAKVAANSEKNRGWTGTELEPLSGGEEVLSFTQPGSAPVTRSLDA